MVCLYPYDKDVDPDTLKILRLYHNAEASSLYVLMHNMLQVEKAGHYLYGEKNDIKISLAQYEELKVKNK